MKDLKALELAGAPLPCQERPGYRVLVVDDEDAVRQLIATLLVEAGYHVDAAEDGVLAWEALQANSYDLMITDNQMPKITGVELVAKLRAARMALPVVMATGALPEEELTRNPSLQIAAILLKPFSVAELLDSVKSAIRLSHPGDELDSPARVLDQKAHASEHSRKLQALSRRLVEAQEIERRNVARKLHDEIGQALTVVQLNLQGMLHSPNVNGLTPRLEQSLRVVEFVLEQVRDISLDLRPSILDHLGLEPALRWYTTRQAALVQLNVQFHFDWLEQRLDPVIETECFRVAQESLTNVVRHARASTVAVNLHAKDSRLHLRVRDDGIGFDVASVREQAVRGASLGLLSMEERAAMAGGGLELKSAPGQGTEVQAWFPLKWQASFSESENAETLLRAVSG